MAVFRRLMLIAISVRAFSQGASPTSGCTQSESSSEGVSLLQLNGVLQAIESALELPEPQEHMIHTPNGPRVAHASHLPVQAAIQAEDSSSHVEAATRDDGHDAPAADAPHPEAPHTDDPHAAPAAPAAPDPHAPPAPQGPEPHAPPALPDPRGPPPPPPAPVEPLPGEPPTAPPHAFDEDRIKEGFENAHPAELTKEKYQYLNQLAAFAIGPGIFFLGALVVATFGLFVYAYKNDPRVF